MQRTGDSFWTSFYRKAPERVLFFHIRVLTTKSCVFWKNFLLYGLSGLRKTGGLSFYSVFYNKLTDYRKKTTDYRIWKRKAGVWLYNICRHGANKKYKEE